MPAGFYPESISQFGTGQDGAYECCGFCDWTGCEGEDEGGADGGDGGIVVVIDYYELSVWLDGD